LSAVTVINCFEVPAGRDDEFLEAWGKVNSYMEGKPGYLRHTLHRAITADAPFRFVNVAHWASMAHFRGAHDAGFRKLIDESVWSAFVSHRVLFEVVREGHAGTL
jgi:heme-degrading monooxygenase HmoA